MVTNWRGEREGYIKAEGCRKLREGEETELRAFDGIVTIIYCARNLEALQNVRNGFSWVFLIR